MTHPREKYVDLRYDTPKEQLCFTSLGLFLAHTKNPTATNTKHSKAIPTLPGLLCGTKLLPSIQY